MVTAAQAYWLNRKRRRARNEGGGWWIPGSQLDLDFANDRAFNRSSGFNGSPNSILTYTSPSPKMVYGGDGVLGYAPPYNLLTYSEQFDNAAWTKSKLTVTANATTAPDGTVTADKVVEDVDVASGHLVTRNCSVTAGVPYTQSVYLKAAERTFAFVLLSGAFTSTAISVNLTTGALVVVVGSALSTSISDAGNGWWRVSLTVAASSTGSGTVSTYTGTGASWSNRQYDGDGVSGLYLWGAQFCNGPNTLTYIPTTSAAVYSLPIDHDPITHAPLGVLIEEQRTNLLLNSEVFSSWVGTLGNTITDGSPAPDGSNTADLFTRTATAAYRGQSVAKAASAITYTQTFFVKQGTGNYATFTMQGSGGSSTRISYRFDFSTETLAFTTKAGSFTDVGTTVVSLINGWYRLSMSFTTDTGTAIQPYFTFSTSALSSIDGADSASTATGFVWGAQLEVGAFPTSYIPTVASQVTRAADQVSIATSAFGYSATEGTVLAEGSINGNGTGNTGWWALDAGATQNGHALRVAVGTSILAISHGASTNQTVTGLASPVAGTFYETAVAYSNENDRAISTEGAAVVSGSTAVGTINPATTLRLGYQQVTTTGGYLNGHIKRLTYWNTRKPNAELQVLSA